MIRVAMILSLLITLVLSAVINATAKEKDGVVRIEKEELLPIYRTDPYPSSGEVLFNAPSFICMPVIKEKKGNNSYVFDYDYQYQFRISKDSKFKDHTTITSELQDWTFFNTHKALEKGDWYWQYAYVKGNEKKWHEPIKFSVTGNESDFVSPSFIDLKAAIEQVHPRMLATPEQVGKIILPEHVKNEMKTRIDKKVGKQMPVLIFNNKEVMAQKKKELSPERYHLYITKRTRDNCKKFSKETAEVVMMYLLTKDQKYRDEALKRYRYFKKTYARIIELKQWLDFTEVAYHAVESEVFDIAYDVLTQEERDEIIKDLSKAQEKTYRKFIHKPSHALHDSHFWQIELRNFFLNSLVLVGHNPEADKWLNYAYDLYIVRAPTGSWNDGGWALGNKYFSANQETLFVMPYLLSRITGFNYFSKPWYQNVAEYLLYTSPIKHRTGSFGDGTDMSSENMVPLVKALNKVQSSVSGLLYEELYDKYGSKASEYPRLTWYSHQPLKLKVPAPEKEKLALAKDFRDVGNVAMHTTLKDPNKDLFVAFRSSPYGVVGHAHAAQNGFSIFYGGEPLFYHTGYYTNWADLHTMQSYRHTRAHNSILADGIGQNFHTSGYGWIPRFVSGDVISYSMGDASKAYSGTIVRDEIANQMKKYGISATPEYGFGDAGVTKFRRHMFLLRPGVVVIYDELEAEKPVAWSWMSNSRCLMELKNEKLVLKSSKGSASMTQFCSADLDQSIRDTFVSPPVDWQGKGKKLNMNETSYHYTAKTSKTKNARFLSVIQIGDKRLKPLVVKKINGGYQVGEWIIQAELDANRPAQFKMTDGKSAVISMGNEQVVLGEKTFSPQYKRSTFLVEFKDGKPVVQEEVDQLPNAAMYY
ncbi:DUF4962 domain-containing protein [Puteibacter caeruleilacunae]|nr:DUF4962 domain-containing protein [Puteibacter caeruleilacunae]